MAVNLKTQLQSSKLTPDEQREVIALDLDRNGTLDLNDLTPRFGKTASVQFMADLESSVQKNDFTKFTGTLGKLEAARAQFFAKTFQTALLQKKGELEGLGVQFQGAKLNFSKVPSDKIDRVVQILGEMFQGPYSKEFEAMTPKQSDDFLFRVKDFVRVESQFDKYRKVSLFHAIEAMAHRFFVEESSRWSAHSYEPVRQKEYAEIEYREIHPSALVTALEKKYGIDIRLSQGDLTAEQAKVLGLVLEKLKNLRPSDFSKIPSLTLHIASERGGGLTHMEERGRIDLFGPFGTFSSGGSLPEGYGEDLLDKFKGDAEAYLTHVLAHEMGHTTENSTVMGFYKKIFPKVHERVLEERFAEDYRMFLLSGGKGVARLGVGQKEIGEYEARLDFMKKNYPLIP